MELGGASAAESLLDYGNQLSNAGNSVEASALAQYGIERYPASPVLPDLYWIVAEAARREWRLDEARAAVDLGLEAAGGDAPLSRQHLLLLEERVWVALGLPELALAPLEEARAVRDAAGPEDRVDEGVLVRHEVALATAVEDYSTAIQLAEEAGPTPELTLLLAIACAEKARLEDAAPTRAEALFTELYSDPDVSGGTRRRASIRHAEILVDRGQLDRARELIELAETWSPAPDLDGRQREETLRARLELAANAGLDVLAERRAALAQVFEHVLERRSEVELREGGVGYLHFIDIRSALSELIELTRRLDGDEAALEELLRVRDLGSLARFLGGPPTDLTAVRRALPPDGGVLSYLPGPSRTHLFLVDRQRVRCVLLAPLRAWNPTRAAAHRELLRAPAAGSPTARTEELSSLLARLASELLPERVQALSRSWSEVCVEGLGLAGYVPVEALPLSDGTPFGLALPITYWPSLSVAARLAARVPERTERLADLYLLAAPADVEREPIRWARRHTEMLARHCTRGGLHAATGEQADRGTLFAPEITRSGWLLMVLHGTYDAERERPAGFLLGSDEEGEQAHVFAEDLERLIPPQLVFLAICGAARGSLRRGDDGVSDLGGTMLRAGAQAVVLSPIDLMFEPTVQLAGRFQRELASGASPAQALLRARRALVAEHPEYDHPYYYAVLHLVGQGNLPIYDAPLELDSSLLRAWPLLGALAVVAAGSFLVARRSARHRPTC